jgi:hypothetical protein
MPRRKRPPAIVPPDPIPSQDLSDAVLPSGPLSRRRFLAGAVLAAGAGAIGRLELLAQPLDEYSRTLGRWRAAVIRAHGQAAWDRWGDIVTESARTYSKQTERPRHAERIAALEQLWVDLVGNFERDMQWIVRQC